MGVADAVRLNPKKVSSESIATIESLCNALSITTDELSQALALTPEQRYHKTEVPKANGTFRAVHNPHHLIRKLQRRINKRIFANQDVIKWPDHVYGSVPNDDTSDASSSKKDYVSCVRQHCGAKSILSADIKDFFDNIHYDQVVNIFKNFLKYPDEVSKVLANICCKDLNVVQGALTSSYIATLCLFADEGEVVKRLKHKGLVYTRLVDDITISSHVPNFDFSYALRLTEQMLHDVGLPLNLQKTKIQHASMAPLIVHGLRVDFSQPRLPPEEPRKIRASVKHLELLAASPGYRASRAYRKDFNRCLGRVNKLQRVGHSQHVPLVERLKCILPLASHKDIERACLLIERLEKDFLKPGYKDSYWFYKRFFVASERLGILKRSFPKIAQELRLRLRSMYPAARYE